MKWYKSFVENNRRLGQEANAFGNEAFGRRTTKDERERMEGWRDKVPDRVRDKVEQGNVTVLETYGQRQNRERKLLAAVYRYSSLSSQIEKRGQRSRKQKQDRLRQREQK